MPELPDVEVFKRYLDQTALGQTVEGVAVNDPRILHGLSPDEFTQRLKGKRFEQSRRHGKHLLVRLDHDGWLTLHFGMTGRLVWFEDLAYEPPYDRVRFDFARGHLGYVNRRMLGRVGVAVSAEEFIRTEGLGPDALDPAFDLEAFKAALRGRRRDLKSVLMDQSLIAGIGNIYADEILFRAGVRPGRPGGEVTPDETERLVAAIPGVLADGVAMGGTSLDDLAYLLPDGRAGEYLDRLAVYGRTDLPCVVCSTPVERVVIAQRSSHFCPSCQT